MNFNNADLIIARYKEDLSWIKSDYDNIFIYNKGETNFNLDKKHETINLNNIGRESHTYLYHIIQNYENLNNVNIFCQGGINDHGMSEKSLFKFYMDAQIYGYSLNKNFYPEWIEPFGGYKDFRIDEHGGRKVSKSKYSLSEWKSEFNICKDNSPFQWYQKAVFAISKDYIHTRTLDFYKNLLEDEELNQLDPEIGHYYERSWVKIFNIE
jgi:hypothetical protein